MATSPSKNVVQRLTNKQLIAVQLYVAGATKSEACRKAGYADPTEMDRLFKNPKVLLEIDKMRAMSRKELSIEVKDVIEGLMEAVHIATNAMEMVAAWREIGRILGAYEHAKKIEIDVSQKVEHIHHTKQLERMSDADLAQLAELGEDFVIDGEFQEVE